MPVVIVILVVVLIAAILYLRSRAGNVPDRSVAGAITHEAPAMAEVDFHVDGATAHVFFDTAIPAGGADDVLEGLMGREGMRVFREKADHLPLEEVRHLTVHGKRDGADVAVTTVNVSAGPAEMDHMDAPSSDDVVRARDVATDDDPLAAISSMDFGRSGGYRGGTDELPPLSSELTIPAKIIESVAGPGGSVAGMSLQDFIAGLLRASGYDVSVSPDGTGTARKSGATTFLQFVDHAAGSHPELDEGSVDSFVMKFVSSGADRGMLFTPKFGPYAIYERERRNDKVKYMTRERLQAFVDSVAMG